MKFKYSNIKNIKSGEAIALNVVLVVLVQPKQHLSYHLYNILTSPKINRIEVTYIIALIFILKPTTKN